MTKEAAGIVETLLLAFKWHTGLLSVVLLVAIMAAMVWRRRGARHVAKRINDGRTPAFEWMMLNLTRALFFAFTVTLIQEASVILWQMTCKR